MTEWGKDPVKDRDSFRNYRRNFHHGVIWGAVICAIGVVLLLDHMGIISADRLWRFWPLVIIVPGIVNLTEAGKRVWGALLFVGGMLLQLDTLGVIRFHWADLWPLAVIAAGLMMIWGSIESRRTGAGSPGGEQNTMNSTAIFGGVERRVTIHDFRRGRVSAVFGGVELDFRDADMQEEQAVLEVNAIFGGAEIRVPETWKVEQRGQTLFGGYTDTTRVSAAGDVSAPKGKTLIITGTTLFGGVEVTN